MDGKVAARSPKRLIIPLNFVDLKCTDSEKNFPGEGIGG